MLLVRKRNIVLCLLGWSLVRFTEGSNAKNTLAAARHPARTSTGDDAPVGQSQALRPTSSQRQLLPRKNCRLIQTTLLRVRGGDNGLDAAASAAAAARPLKLKLHLAGKLLPALKDTLKLGPNAGAAFHGILDATLFSVRSSGQISLRPRINQRTINSSC